jgi:hypothetical protein
MMITHTEIELIGTSSIQTSILNTLVRENALTMFPEMVKEGLSLELTKTSLLLHMDAGVLARAHSLSSGLEFSPTAPTADGSVFRSTGAGEVDACLASALAALFHNDHALSLLVPHAYAKEDELQSLQIRAKVPARFLGGHVHYCFDATNSEAGSITKALGSGLAMYSVSWLVRGNGCQNKPVLAMVPVFDGDGWGLMGEVKDIFPKLSRRMNTQE